MKERLALIDLDTLVYIIAYRQFNNGNRDNELLVKNHIKEFISTILINTRADFVAMAYQKVGHSNFRKGVYPDYKSTRPEAPEFITVWKKYILSVYEELGAIGVNVIETDDWNSIGYYKFKDKYEVITVSSDKDLEQVPGEHYNPSKNEGFFIAYSDSWWNVYLQQLTGDVTDSIQGIFGVGPAKAEKILNNRNISGDIQLIIFNAYKSAYSTEGYNEFIKTRFLVTLLKSENFSFEHNNNLVTVQIKRNLFNIQRCSDLITTNIF